MTSSGTVFNFPHWERRLEWPGLNPRHISNVDCHFDSITPVDTFKWQKKIMLILFFIIRGHISRGLNINTDMISFQRSNKSYTSLTCFSINQHRMKYTNLLCINLLYLLLARGFCLFETFISHGIVISIVISTYVISPSIDNSHLCSFLSGNAKHLADPSSLCFWFLLSTCAFNSPGWQRIVAKEFYFRNDFGKRFNSTLCVKVFFMKHDYDRWINHWQEICAQI